MNHEKLILDNGLVLLTMPIPSVRSVCVSIFVVAGARCESGAEAGASHFIEHMLFKGSAKYPSARAISEAIEGIGGFINAGTGREATVYWGKVAHPHARVALEVLSDMLINPIMDPEEYEKERQVIVEEINMLHDSPETLTQMFINDLVWSGHPLGREISGTKESVSELRRDSLLSYMERHYGPSTTVVSVAGAIETPFIRALVTECFAGWRPAAGTTIQSFCDDQTEKRVKVFFKETEQAHICVALPSLPRDHPDQFTLTLANTILGDGMSSRLFQEIRERQALAYSVDSFLMYLQDTGMLGVYAGVDPSRAERALEAVMSEVSRMKDELVTSVELRRAIEYNKGRLLLQMENTSSVAAWYGRQEVLPGRVYSVDEVVELMETTTQEDIQRVMCSLLEPKRLNLAVVGPFKDGDGFARRLELG